MRLSQKLVVTALLAVFVVPAFGLLGASAATSGSGAGNGCTTTTTTSTTTTLPGEGDRGGAVRVIELVQGSAGGVTTTSSVSFSSSSSSSSTTHTFTPTTTFGSTSTTKSGTGTGCLSTTSTTTTTLTTRTHHTGNNGPTGSTGLLSNTLMITGGNLGVPLACTSNTSCGGSLQLFLLGGGASRKTKHAKAPACTGKSKYHLKKGQHKTVKLAIRKRCLTFLKHHHNRGRGKLVNHSTTGQKGFTKSVKLVLQSS